MGDGCERVGLLRFRVHSMGVTFEGLTYVSVYVCVLYEVM